MSRPKARPKAVRPKPALALAPANPRPPGGDEVLAQLARGEKLPAGEEHDDAFWHTALEAAGGDVAAAQDVYYERMRARVAGRSGRPDPARNRTADELHREATEIAHAGGMVLDQFDFGGGKSIIVTGLSCLVVPGPRPTPCPRAAPWLPPHLLPDVQRAISRLYPLPAGTTVHWLGHEAGRAGCRCQCHPDAPYAAPFERHRWAEVAARETDPPTTLAVCPNPKNHSQGRRRPGPKGVRGAQLAVYRHVSTQHVVGEAPAILLGRLEKDKQFVELVDSDPDLTLDLKMIEAAFAWYRREKKK